MQNDYVNDFFEQLYSSEIQQKQHLDSLDGFLVGIVGALIGVGAYLLQILSKTEFSSACCFLWAFGIPYILSLAGALGFVIWSVVPRYKEYISSPQQWAEYVRGYEAYHGYFHKEPKLSERVAIELRQLSRQQYVQAGETNRQLLYKKDRAQARAKWCIITGIVFMVMSAFPTYFILRDEARELKNEQQTKPTGAVTNPVAAVPAPVRPARTDGADVTNSSKPAAKASPANGGPNTGGRVGTK